MNYIKYYYAVYLYMHKHKHKQWTNDVRSFELYNIEAETNCRHFAEDNNDKIADVYVRHSASMS